MYRTLRACVDDLALAGQLVTIDAEIDANLEAAQIQRRVWAAGGPAIYFANVRGCSFPMVCNLFGTLDRLRFIFRDTLRAVEKLIELKVDPLPALRRPWQYAGALPAALQMLPKRVSSGPVLAHQTTISKLPQLKSWPGDGGAFITLPAVYTEDPESPGWRRSNLGMYRVQLSGGRYEPDREVGMHYQIHRGIGVHHAKAIQRGEPLPVNIHVGGPPALAVAAVMPLPEGLSELSFAGALAGHRMPLITHDGWPAIQAEADFCITGWVHPDRQLPEGPFGDHLGYYSLVHDFPVMTVRRVYHRTGAIWPFTTVGRPPQEDTTFGQFIHELTGPVVPTLIPGVREVHAVDAAGVHPLLLAIGSERYVPYATERRPQELLTQANAILGQGQMSLAKYLIIAAHEDNQRLKAHNIESFLMHVLERVDWQTDLHFQTCTTIDTLDYSGTGLNQGSKVVIGAAGPARRRLPLAIEGDLKLPEGFTSPRIALPGVLCLTARGFAPSFFDAFRSEDPINQFPLIVLCDDSEFTTRTINNFLWVTFTRSNPAADVYGVDAFTEHKHWGCRGSLVIDARTKTHHAPPLEEDPAVTRRVDALAAPGGPLHGIL